MTRSARLPRSPHPAPVSLLLLSVFLIGCGGGSSGGGNNGGGDNGGGNSGDWTPGVFAPAADFRARCVNPRSGTDPATGQPYPDVAGTMVDENNFLRSYSNDTYLWYDEIVDRDPALYQTPDYFDLLKTDALTAAGTPKDKFHFTYDSDEWYELSQSGVSAGYGVQWVLLSASPPREAVVAYIDPNTPADAAGLLRGTRVLAVNGTPLVDGDAAALNAGMFPDSPGETHTFTVRDPDGTERDVTMTSEIISSTPVQNVKIIPTATGDVGYLTFNDHIRPAEPLLVDAFTQLANAQVSDLVVDLRYNGGGFLFIASEFAYMVAGSSATAGRAFEDLQFNDKHPTVNPVTGQTLTPIPFFNADSNGEFLPALNLSRLFVLTGPGTCSASEAIMNGLRGIDIEVIQVGSPTCGKPYGFYPTDNCGTTYFTIQFRGVNDKGFGDYSDGFAPQNAGINLTILPGCQVADDFEHPLGDPAEARLAAALAYRDGQGCPSPSSVAVPGLSKVGAPRWDESQMVVPKPAWRTMRILQP